jgi:hypothetical protein
LSIDAVAIASYCGAFSRAQSNPAAQITVNATGGGSGGGSLAAGTYFVSVTWIDSLSGKESSIGSTRSTRFTVASGNIPRITMGAAAAWVSGINIYLTPANGATGTEVLYARNVSPATTYDLSVANTGTVHYPTSTQLPSSLWAVQATASQISDSVAYLAPNPWSRAAYLDHYRHQLKYSPLLNSWFGLGNSHNTILTTYNATAGQPPGYVPYLITYEGGIESVTQGGSSSGNDLLNRLPIDFSYDPAMADCELTHMEICQQGLIKQTHDFFLANDWRPNIGTLWAMINWTGQPTGLGDGSPTTTTGSEVPLGTNVTNQFWTFDQTGHYLTNVSPRLHQWRIWAENANPASIARPVVTGVNPANGSTGGGTPVTISGANFTGVTAVQFGSTAAASYAFVNDTTITATSPAAAVSRTSDHGFNLGGSRNCGCTER